VSDEGKRGCWEVFQVGKERWCVGVTFDGFGELELPNYLGAVVKSRVKLEGARSEASEARPDSDDKYLTTSILVPSALRSPLRVDIRRSGSKFSNYSRNFIGNLVSGPRRCIIHNFCLGRAGTAMAT
jgi:hypothetical protein